MTRDRGRFRALVVDDEQMFARAVAREISRRGLACDVAFCGAEAMERAAGRSYQAILLDHRLPDEDGIRLIPRLLALQSGASLIVMTAYDSIGSAIFAIRQGAEDYLVKQTNLSGVVNAVLEVRRRHEVQAAMRDRDEHRRGGLLGSSPAIAAVREQIEKVASRPDTTVLLTGETGAGKEVAARCLHSLSAAPGSPFVAVDCVALPTPLVESILFGHEKGVFTGADRARDGAFQEAGEGTIFLDEIGEMDQALQGKLLRVLEARAFQRVGSVREHPVRARVVTATNRDLAAEAEAGRFRFDLFQRLSVFPIRLPPLRDRGEDVIALARHFLEFFGKKTGVPARPFAREVEDYLRSYDYPGNVRELKNVIERATILAGEGPVEPRHLPDRILRHVSTRAPASQGSDARQERPRGLPVDFVPGVDTLESLELKMIRRAMEQARGVKSETARLLGISRFQLLRRLEKYRIAVGPRRD
ncbi:MAG: sigma-54-dependent Fis family transcriptional regulator [Deltaproteobacteria bacterium]|nr:sigma-54-dependent Fis family transcriptional regulator [Deltaproteobacteria bacterium]